MLLLHKNALLLSTVLAGLTVASCGGGSTFGASSNKDAAKKETNGGDKEDDGADLPAEVAGAFLDDGSGPTTKLGIKMKDLDGKKVSSSAGLTVKLFPAAGAPKVVPTSAAPDSSEWNLYAVIPSAERAAGGDLQLRLVDGTSKRSGKIKMSQMPTQNDGVFGPAGDSIQTPNSDRAGDDGPTPAVQGETYDADPAFPKSDVTSLAVMSAWMPSSGVELNKTMFPGLLCDQAGKATSKFVDALSGLGAPDVKDRSYAPKADHICFERFASLPLPSPLSFQNLMAQVGIAALSPPPLKFLPASPTNACRVVKGRIDGSAIYLVVKAPIAPEDLRTFLRSYHCKSETGFDASSN